MSLTANCSRNGIRLLSNESFIATANVRTRLTYQARKRFRPRDHHAVVGASRFGANAIITIATASSLIKKLNILIHIILFSLPLRIPLVSSLAPKRQSRHLGPSSSKCDTCFALFSRKSSGLDWPGGDRRRN